MIEILTAAFANFLTRFLPFIFLRKYANRFLFLKDDFPVVLLTILTLYIIFPKNVEFQALSYQLIAILVTVVLHLTFKKALVSIFLGSFFYIFLLNYSL